MKKIGILFVCLGNICRSPMAEAIFRHTVMQNGLDSHYLIDSCGTGGWHIGEPPHYGTQQILDINGISWKGQTARKLTKEDFENFDFIFAMDQANLKEISRFSAQHNVMPRSASLLLDYHPSIAQKDVPDPYYTGEFGKVFELLKVSIDCFLKQNYENSFGSK